MKNTSQKGFTLIELLIASAIFAVIMVMATAVFSLTSSYNTKISEMRNVLSDARSAMTQISNDVRLSNGSASVNFGSGSGTPVKDIFLVTISSSGTMTSISTQDGTGADPRGTAAFGYSNSNTMQALGIIRKSDNKIIIYKPSFDSLISSYNFSRTEIPVADTLWGSAIDITGGTPAMINNNTSLDVRFTGYMVATKAQQSFVNIGIFDKSISYDTLSANYRSQVELRSSVESRDYN